jgi:hypothetical protein
MENRDAECIAIILVVYLLLIVYLMNVHGLQERLRTGTDKEWREYSETINQEQQE